MTGKVQSGQSVPDFFLLRFDLVFYALFKACKSNAPNYYSSIRTEKMLQFKGRREKMAANFMMKTSKLCAL